MINKFIHTISYIIFILIVSVRISYADISVPQKINYQGRLIDNSTGRPITTEITIRFSIWSSGDFNEINDITGSGEINTSAPNFTGWQETLTLTPSFDGLFQVELGSVQPLPNLYKDIHKYLQTEIKYSNESNTYFEVLDPKPLDNLIDRKPLNSAPHSINADTIDNHDIGTEFDDIAVLNTEDQWDIQYIPEGTNENNFILDYDNNELSQIVLKFGNALNKMLYYDIIGQYFVFNDSLVIEEDLDVKGDMVIGDDTTQLAVNSRLVSPLNFNQNQALSLVLESGTEFPLTPVAGQKFFRTDLAMEYVYNGTQWITYSTSQSYISDTLIPEYNGYVLEPDGTNNYGNMSLEFDETIQTNYFKWYSTKPFLNDYTLIIKYKLPLNFGSWRSTLATIEYKTNTDSHLDNKIDIEAYDTNGNIIVLNNASNLASSTWNTIGLTASGTSYTFTPGEYIVLKITTYSLNDNDVKLGDITFNYNVI